MVGSRSFQFGFVLNVLVCILVNVYAYSVANPPCCDRSVSFGFPLPLGTTGGYAGGYLSLPGLIFDIAIWLSVSVTAGWWFERALPQAIKKAHEIAEWHVNTRL